MHARVRDGTITVGRGPIENANLVIETGPAMRLLMAGEISPAEALKKKLVKIVGNPKLLDRFAATFRI